MSEGRTESDQQLTRSDATKLSVYRRRMLLIGFAILTTSVLVGVGFSFYQWDRGSPFEVMD